MSGKLCSIIGCVYMLSNGCILLNIVKSEIMEQVKGKGKAVPLQAWSALPRGFQKVKVPRLHDNGTGWW